MADINSVQAQKVVNGTLLDINEHGSRVRQSWFEAPAVWDAAQNDRLDLGVKLPKGARVLGGRLNHGALGASVTVDMGWSDAPNENRYLSAYNGAAAGETDFANTIALNMGDVLTVEKSLFAKFEAANPAANIAFKGYVNWVLD